MLNKFVASLLFAVSPIAAFAEAVELRSSDGFISVVGEVVDFNGAMLSVDTSVGRVSVPASEVGCYGAACAALLSSNGFGLSATDLDGVYGDEGGTPVAVTASSAQEMTAANRSVSFAQADLSGLFETVAGAFAVAGEMASLTDLSNPGIVSLQDEAGTQSATLSVSEDPNAGDIQIAITPLTGSADMQYPAAGAWALTGQPSYQMLGLKALAVIVPGNIAIDSISVRDLAGIYAGEITNWSELGGPSAKILPLQLPEGAGARRDLNRIVMAPEGKQISPRILTMADERSIVASVNQFPGSIAVVSFDSIGADNVTLAVSGSCGLSVTPSEFNVISGDYPLLRPVFANHRVPANIPLLRELFEFASGNVTQALLARDGYVKQGAITQDEVDRNLRLNLLLNASMDEAERATAAQMFQDIFPAERLSSTMFGGPTSGPEGAWNRAMFRQLADVLKSGSYAGREVLFVGFASSANGPADAVDISRKAAEDMNTAFAQYAPDIAQDDTLKFASRGFGNIAPAACYGGQVKGNAHSRVEVWVR